MKEVLEEILKELKYQTKLLEEIVMRPKNPQMDEVQEKMDLLKKELLKHAGLNQNPDSIKALNKLFNLIPKGGER